MDQLSGMRTFVRVAERGSFSAVAREMNSNQSQISRQVAALESLLGTALLNRTTRQVQLTTEGQLYLEFARRAISEADEGAALLRGANRTLTGRVRLSTSTAIYRCLLRKPLAELMGRHSEFELDVMLSGHRVDLVSAGLDLAVRLGELSDSGLIARKLLDTPLVVVAAPSYLRRWSDVRPAVVAPAALGQHDCIIHTSWRDPRWHFEDERGGRQAIAVDGRWRFDDALEVAEAAESGLGVTMLPRFIIEDGLQRGALVQLLSGFRTRSMPLHAVYLGSRRHVARVEAIVQALLQHFQPVAST